MIKRGYNVISFVDEDTNDLVVAKEANERLLYPESEILVSSWANDTFEKDLSLFLTYASIDKEIIDNLFIELQMFGINARYNKYEIVPSDCIDDKINKGLDKCDLGIICISKNFMNFSTGWTKSELNHYIKNRVRSGKRDFICLNFDVNHEELPPLVQEYRYIDLREDTAKSVLIDTLKRKVKKHKNLA